MKTILVGVSGGIAAYKACDVVSKLRQIGYNVKVIMTENARQFVTPLTFETLSHNEVVTEMFAQKKEYDVKHISLAKEGDLFLVCPATANVIAKFAQGLADDMLSTVFMASKALKIVCPAMNAGMYTDEATKTNISLLKERGIKILEPDQGFLACGDTGKGRLAEPSKIVSFVDSFLTPQPDLRGKKILITAGATVENIDGVRFISNYSSGKMGMALASAAAERGGEVTVIAGRIEVAPPKGIRLISVASTEDMYDKVMANLNESDIIIKAAAVSDYKVLNKSDNKIKGGSLTLELTKNIDIAKEVGKKKGNKILVIFSAETNDLCAYASEKLESKNADMVVANDVGMEGAGFGTDTNIATIIYRDGRIESLPLMQKRELADIILDGVLSL